MLIVHPLALGDAKLDTLFFQRRVLDTDVLYMTHVSTARVHNRLKKSSLRDTLGAAGLTFALAYAFNFFSAR